MDMSALTKEFAPSEIKKRRGRGGEVWTYVEVGSVIERLNAAFGGDWTFEVVSHEEREGEVVVLGNLCAEGICKSQFGSKRIEEYKDGGIISIGDDMKAAASDALKKCASLFGVGLRLDTPVEPKPAPPADVDAKGDDLVRLRKKYVAMLPGWLKKDDDARRAFHRMLVGKDSCRDWDKFEMAAAIARVRKGIEESGKMGLVWNDIAVTQLWSVCGSMEKGSDDGDEEIPF